MLAERSDRLDRPSGEPMVDVHSIQRREVRFETRDHPTGELPVQRTRHSEDRVALGHSWRSVAGLITDERRKTISDGRGSRERRPHAHGALGEPGLDKVRRERVRRRRNAVYLLDEHSVRRLAASTRTLDEYVSDRACDSGPTWL